MNRVEAKDLVVGELYWYVEYAGESKPAIQTLVKILALPPTPNDEIYAQNVLTGEAFHPFMIYTYFEPVHVQYVPNQIKALEAQQLRIAAQLAIYKSL